MKKVLFIATLVKNHMMEFHVPYLKLFKEMSWETAVAAKNDYEDPADCIIPYCDTFYDVPFERSPLKPGNLTAYRLVKKIIDKGNYNIIHCHTPVGAMITRLAARDARKKGTQVVYTAHGFHFYKGAPLLNWFVYYPVEVLLARYTDLLITINQEDFKRAKRFAVTKPCYIPGVGIDVSRFQCEHPCASGLREQLRIPGDALVLVSIGDVNKNKNHAIVIEALKKLKDDSIYYIIAGRGPLLNRFRQQLAKDGLDSHVSFLGYRNDVPDLYALSDVFVFPSYREGLSVSVMEAMASGLPVICSKIRGNTDMVVDRENGFLIPPDDCEGLIEAIRSIRDIDTRKRISVANIRKSDQYRIESIVEAYKTEYLKLV